ncbi:TRAP transporter substrate-binding protein DctP [Celerinatantimonas sp. MCCC 1A17872]|uniref:TRAP transporter substrate-binding protein DctP n=1 Tax=Celerinatantimonas sp. MCCC 1A17872 TaxID=3177514 RepID=UPI0038C28132
MKLKTYFHSRKRQLTAVAFTSAMLMSGFSSQAFATETLTFASNTALSGLRGEAEKGFVDTLEKVSHGEIKVVPYWGGSLLKGNEILDGVKNGVADMGFVNINYYPTRLLLNSAFQLFPEGPEDFNTKMKLYNEIYKQIPQLNQEFAAQGQKIIYSYTYLPYAFISRDTLKTTADIKGKRIRASSRWLLNILDGMGATPVSVPWSDTYQALQSGTIDGVMTNYDSLHRVGMDQIAPNILTTKKLWVAVPILITINQSKWDQLSPKMKGYFNEARKVATQKFGQYYNKSFNKIVYLEKKAGYHVNAATPAEINAIVTSPAIKKNRDLWLKDAKQKNAKNPEQILDKMGALIKQSLGQ